MITCQVSWYLGVFFGVIGEGSRCLVAIVWLFVSYPNLVLVLSTCGLTWFLIYSKKYRGGRPQCSRKWFPRLELPYQRHVLKNFGPLPPSCLPHIVTSGMWRLLGVPHRDHDCVWLLYCSFWSIGIPPWCLGVIGGVFWMYLGCFVFGCSLDVAGDVSWVFADT